MTRIFFLPSIPQLEKPCCFLIAALQRARRRLFLLPPPLWTGAFTQNLFENDLNTFPGKEKPTVTTRQNCCHVWIQWFSKGQHMPPDHHLQSKPKGHRPMTMELINTSSSVLKVQILPQPNPKPGQNLPVTAEGTWTLFLLRHAIAKIRS